MFNFLFAIASNVLNLISIKFWKMDLKLEASWSKALEKEISKPYFTKLMQFVKNEYSEKPEKIFPREDQIFRALNLCPLDKVKVVILGQDPYPTRGYAHGLCFSVEENVKPFPKSLNNIFKELESDLDIPVPSNGSLERWAEQGVLLLNVVLTVEEGKAESHAKKGWENFTEAVIEVLNARSEGLVYLLWGTKAREKAALVNDEENLVLTSVHPSPLSAYRGFLGSKHFSQTNNYLIEQGKEPINW